MDVRVAVSVRIPDRRNLTVARSNSRMAGANAVRYPDPDIVFLDKRFDKIKIGNTPVQRLYTGTLWSEGPAWNGVGRYLNYAGTVRVDGEVADNGNERRDQIGERRCRPHAKAALPQPQAPFQDGGCGGDVLKALARAGQ